MTVDEQLSFDEFLRFWAKERPAARALIEEDRILSYAELEARTAQVVSALNAAGLKKGDRIAWLGKNSDLYFTLFYGAARAGIVMVPIGWRLAAAVRLYLARYRRAVAFYPDRGLMRRGGRSRRPCPPSSAFLPLTRRATGSARRRAATLRQQGVMRQCSNSIPRGQRVIPRARCFRTATSSGCAYPGSRPICHGRIGRMMKSRWSRCHARILAAPGLA